MAQYGVYTATGHKRRTIYGKTRTEVARKLARAISNQDNGFTFDSQNLTVGDYLDSWLKNSVHDTVRVTTYQGYERIVRLHIKPTLEGIKLDRLTPSNRAFPRPAAYLRHPPLEQEHVKLVQELLGHSTIAVTLDTYNHVLPSMGDGLADTMDEALG
jgi:hypothetical protein